MRPALLLAVTALVIAPAQSAPKFDSNRAYEDMRQMIAIGPRPAGSAALQKTRDYIEKELKAVGLTPQEQAFDAQTPIGTIHMVNVSVTVPGQTKDKGRIVIGGHYDTKLEHDFQFVGASDGASSAAFVLEMARTLKARTNRLPIELVFLDGEEAVRKDWDVKSTDHTYGSRYFVQQLKKAGKTKDVRAFILLDMIGAKNLRLIREQFSTPWLTDAMWSAAKRLNRAEFVADAPTPIEDDHLEFLDASIPSVDLIDLQDYPQWHTAQDDLSHVAAGSLQAVGDVVIAALPAIEKTLTAR
jgi:glutaminyl-peptide cyclotransferase